MEDDREPLVDALLAAPVGVCLVAALEGMQRGAELLHHVPADSRPDAVRRAADAVSSLSFGRVAEAAVEVGVFVAGAWMSDAPLAVATAYRNADARRPIAEAVVARFGAELERSVDLRAQEWWTTQRWIDASPQSHDLDDVYDAGEFTFGGRWTCTAPPVEALVSLEAAWEMDPDPVLRRHLPVEGTPRVWEVHRPGDWVRLVEAHPKDARPHGSWSLPGPNRARDGIAELVAVPGQHAARLTMTSHRVPDWRRVADDIDAVHLSWAGFITSEGFVSDLPSGGVAMLRFWHAERTLWLRYGVGAG